MEKKVVLLRLVLAFALVISMFQSDSIATIRDSEDFIGVLFEGNQIPTAAVPVWDKLNDTAIISSADGKLNVNTMGGSVVGAWILPGQYGAETVVAANRHYTNGNASNPWNPSIANLGYTVELSVNVIDSAVGQWGFALQLGEASGGCLTNIQIFKDQIKNANGTVYYSGDLSGEQHIVRLIRNPGLNSTPGNLPSIDLYVDGNFAYTITSYSIGGQMANSGWNQDWLYLGSVSSGAKYNVALDYLRVDFTGAYQVPEPTTLALVGLASLGLFRRKNG